MSTKKAKTVKCPGCDGTGVRRRYTEEPISVLAIIDERCRACEGTGRVAKPDQRKRSRGKK